MNFREQLFLKSLLFHNNGLCKMSSLIRIKSMYGGIILLEPPCKIKKSVLPIILMFFLISLAFLATADSSHAADTIYVNGSSGNDTYDGTSPTWVNGTVGPKKTINNASNAVDTNGTVYVSSGTYNEHLNISRSLSLIGQNTSYPIIDGTLNGRVVLVSGSINVNIINFIIRNGLGDYGSAIYTYNSNVNLINSTVSGNNATSGGAIYAGPGSKLSIVNSTLSSNYGNNGGTIYTDSSSDLTILNSVFSGNIAEYYGGAIYAISTPVNINNSIFNGNTAIKGGAIYKNSGNLIITNSNLSGNTAVANHGQAAQGGGIRSIGGILTISGSNLYGNSAGNGDVLYNNDGTVNLQFNRVIANSTHVISTNSTINAEYNWWGSNSEPSGIFSGIGVVDCNPWIYMTFIANPHLILMGGTSNLTASFNNAYNGTNLTSLDPAGGYLADGCVVTFTTDLGSVGSKNTSNGVAIAPLLADEDTGIANVSAQLDDQILNSTVVIKDNILYVNGAVGNDSWDGTSPTWVNGTMGPMKTIQTAVNAINNDGTVNVASGIYNEHLVITKSLNLIGTNPDDTIIDGTNNGRVVLIPGFINLSIANFTIRNGLADYGAAISKSEFQSNGTTTLTLLNLIILENNATERGGGIYAITCQVNVINSTLSGNIASSNGGAIYASSCNVTILNSIFHSNIASSGAGIHSQSNFDTILAVTGSEIYNNSANIGGGITISRGILNVTGSKIFNNSANDGGGIYNSRSSGTLVDSYICNNNALHRGGGIYLSDSSGYNPPKPFTLYNCNISNNTADRGGGFYLDTRYNGYDVNIIECIISNNNASVHGGGGYIVQGNVHFCKITNNTAPLGSDIYSVDVVDATLNWWGSNQDPSSRVYGATVTPWLVVSETANPKIIGINDTSIISVDLLHDSYGVYHDPTNGHVPDGIPVSFNTTLGTIDLNGSTVNGTASVNLIGGGVVGFADVTATVENGTACITVPFLLPNSVYNSRTLEIFSTIVGAMNDADTLTGDTIVAYGDFTENISVNKPLIISGGCLTNITASNVGQPVFLINPTGAGTVIDGFNIKGGSTGIYVNCAGNCNITENTITGNSWSGIGINGAQGTVIEGNTVSGNQEGIYILNGAMNNIIRDNTVINNQFSGICLDRSSYNNIINNGLVSGNSNGLRLFFASDNVVTGNNIVENLWAGVILDGSSENLIGSNNINYNVEGVHLMNNATENNITSNNITGNNTGDHSWCGISVWASSENRADNNHIILNQEGIYLTGASQTNIVQNNIIHHQKFTGVCLDQNSSQNNILNNIIYSNSIGIRFYQASWNNITKNNISSNVWAGICLDNSANNTVNNNTAIGNVEGIFLFNNCNQNIITWNKAQNNTYTGINLDVSNGNTVGDNLLSGNSSGIRLHYADDNILNHNNATNNTWTAVCLDNSNRNNLTLNTIVSMNEGLYCMGGCTNNNIYSNNFKLSGGWRLACDDSDNNYDNGVNTGNYWNGVSGSVYAITNESNGITNYDNYPSTTEF